jgi:isopentenyl diphosphate isomerase/L-lactate dehydrogenase-like FMN-dependent dehydrogenase
VPQSWINVADAERAASKRLEPGPLAYFNGGSGDEETLRENVAAWRRLRLLPRVLVDNEAVSTACELLGKPATMPILVAPVALQRLAHPDGEEAMARAAAAAGAVMCHSTLATASPTEVRAAVPEGRRWFQLYCFKDKGVNRALVDEAVAAGYEAIALTVDAPPAGQREREIRTGFRIAAETRVPGLDAALGAGRSPTMVEVFGAMDHGLDWDDLAELVEEVPLPLFLKGISAAADAELAIEHGAAGVVVSNHGGRQLERSVATAEALPAVAEAVAGRVPVLVDGGIRRGVDVALALALGADAVLVGRPALWGLAAGGEEGARRVLEMLRSELEVALALCGVTSPTGLTRDHALSGPLASVYSGSEPN